MIAIAQVPRGMLLQALHAQARTLRQLSLYDTFGADVLAAVRPLSRLTMLRLRKGNVRAWRDAAYRPRSWADLQGHEFSLRWAPSPSKLLQLPPTAFVM